MTATDMSHSQAVGSVSMRGRLATIDQSTDHYLNEWLRYILDHRAVNHPLLNYYQYTVNPFTKRQEKLFYLECWYYFLHEPFYVAAIAQNTRDYNILREIAMNVMDEVGESITHEEQFRQELNMLGITDAEIATYQCLPSTTALNQGGKELYSNPPIERALGAWFTNEAISSQLAIQLNAGLENQGYDEKIRYHWLSHIEIEKGHSNNAFNAIAPYVTSEAGRQKFELGLHSYLHLLESFWDGVDHLIRRDGTD